MRLVFLFFLSALFPTLIYASENFLGREYLLIDGRQDKSQSALMIVVMHGFLGNAKNMKSKTTYDQLAAAHGLVVLYPNGRKSRWNDGRSQRNRVDDVKYLAALVSQFVSSGVANKRRIFFAGHSNGGGMAMRMACDRPDLVRGIAVVATKTSVNYQCKSGQPVPAMFIHGTKDPIAPHAGRSKDSRLGASLSSRATLRLWAKRNGCAAPAKSTMSDRVADKTTSELLEFARCKAPLKAIILHGHGHDWPNHDGQATRLQGPASQEIDASVESLKFFKEL